VIAYNRVARTLFSAATRASQDTETLNTVQLGPFELAGKEPLKLQIPIDASVIEVFADGRACLTERAYPARRAWASGCSRGEVMLNSDRWRSGR